MKKFYAQLLFIFLFVAPQLALSQEICDNGIDDDANGLIDCYDSQCNCEDFYVGDNLDCDMELTENPTFSFDVGWQTTETVWGATNMVVGDVDGDNISEIFAGTRNTNDGSSNGKVIRVFNGLDGALKLNVWISSVANLPNGKEAQYFGISHAIADVTGSGAYLFVPVKFGTTDENTFHIVAFDFDLANNNYTHVWTSSQSIAEVQDNEDYNVNSVGHIGVADFNHDGVAEVYVKNQIFDATTGRALAKLPPGEALHVNGGTVAIDVLPASATCPDCDGLELVGGNRVYSVDLGDGTELGGEVKVANELIIPKMDNFGRGDTEWVDYLQTTSIADMDVDGDLDAVFGADINGRTYIVYWDMVDNSDFSITQTDQSMKYGVGRINIGDLNGDQVPDVSFVAAKIQAHYFNKDTKGFDSSKSWNVVEHNGVTGSTVFDFNDDGVFEIVYRSASWFYIFDGGVNVRAKVDCPAATLQEYPIVADIDGDGSTEICVVCSDSNKLNDENTGRIRMYEAGGTEAWVPARKLWNQHGYFNVNINDDLSVPLYIQDHSIEFPINCNYGSTGDTKPPRPLNKFLSQSAYLEANGCPVAPVPDFKFVNDSIGFIPPVCPNTEVGVVIEIENAGSVEVSTSLPVSFYSADPTLATTTDLDKIATVNLDLVSIFGTNTYVDTIMVDVGSTNYNLFVSLNDDGITIPVDHSTMPVDECKFEDNVQSVAIQSEPLDLYIEKGDMIHCDPGYNGNVYPNGWVTAKVIEPSGDTTAVNYDFHLIDSNGITICTSSTGVFPDIYNDTYMVSAEHTTFACNADTTDLANQVTVNLVSLDASSWQPEVVSIIQYDTACLASKATGIVAVKKEPLISGNVQYEPALRYEWYPLGSTDDPDLLIGIGDTLWNLPSNTYSVKTIDTLSGCFTQFTVDLVKPDQADPVLELNVTNSTQCDPQNGMIAANILGNDINNYTFEWYAEQYVDEPSLGAPLAGETNDTLANVVSGYYSFKATNTFTGCTVSGGAFVDFDPVPNDAFTIESIPQTSCDTSLPNGSLSVTPESGYTFRWFAGTDTTNFLVSNDTVSNLAQGTYILMARSNTTGCVSFDTTQVTQVLTYPTAIEISNSAQTNCLSPDGRVELGVNGVTDLTDYTFEWTQNDGTVLATSSNIVSTLSNEFSPYTVTVTNTVTHCPSVSISVSVGYDPVDPAFTANVTSEQVSCDVSNPMGSVEIITTNTTDPISYAGYTYEWRLADTTYTTVQNPTNLAAGTYTLLATDITTNCIFEYPDIITITPEYVYPQVNLINIVDNTLCNGGDGFAEVDVTLNGVPQNAADYTIEWYNETQLIGTNITSIDTLTEKTYKVVAIRNLTDCPSDTLFVSINTVPVDPGFSAQVVQRDYMCSTTEGLGIIEAIGGTGFDSSNPDALYDFKWYLGKDTTVTPVEEAYRADNLLGNRAYSLVVTSKTTACEFYYEEIISLPDSVENSTMSIVDFAHLTDCNDPNGWAQAKVINNGIEQPSANYTFEWTLSGAPIAVTTDSATELSAGTYSVRAMNNVSNCWFGPATITIEEQPVDPGFEIKLLAHQTACVPDTVANGSVEAWKADGVYTGFTYEWYDLATNTLLNPGEPNLRGIDELPAGGYKLIVFNSDNCSFEYTAPAIVENRQVDPVITATSTDNTVCQNFNGTATISITEGTTAMSASDYEITWTNTSTGVEVASAANSFTATGLGADGTSATYSVEVKNKITACVMTQNVTVDYTEVKPDFTIIKAQDNISCDDTAPLGILEAVKADGDYTDYTFEWFEGQNTLLANKVSDSRIATGLEDGKNYTVLVTDNVTGCSFAYYNAAIEIIENPAPAPIINVSMEEQKGCKTANGSVSAYVGATKETAGYTFYWFYGTEAKTTAEADFVGDTWDNIESGDYTVFARVDSTGCFTDPKPALVTLDKLDFQNEATKLDSDDDGFDCIIDMAYVSTGLYDPVTFTPIDSAKLDIQWYKGGTPVDAGSIIPGSTNDSIFSVSPGTYTVEITSQESGCTYYATHTFDPVVFTVVLNEGDEVITPVSQCGAGNGSISNVANKNFIATETYRYYLFDGLYEDDFSEARTSIDAVGNTPVTFDNLPAGDYTIVSLNILDADCKSAAVNYTIDEQVAPPVTAETIVNNSSCATPNGSIVVQASADAADAFGGTSYTFQWEDAGNNPLAVGTVTNTATQTQVTGLAEGTYNLIVIDNTTTCRDTITYDLEDKLINAAVSAEAVNVTKCISPDGDVLIRSITPATATYDLYLFNSAVGATNVTTSPNMGTIMGVDASAIPAAGVLFNADLAAGTYYVYAVDQATECISSLSQVTVGDDSALPELTLVSSEKNTSCDPSLATGMLTYSVSSDNDDSAGYDYTWEDAAANTVKSGTVAAGTDITLEDVVGGTYTLNVTNKLDDCTVSVTRLIGTDTKSPYIAFGVQNPQTCGGNGVAQVTFIADNNDITSGFTFNLYDDVTNPPIDVLVLNNETEVNAVNTTPVSFSLALAPGTYHIIGTNNASGCTFEDDVTIAPYQDNDFAANEVAWANEPDTYCSPTDPTTGTGALMLMVDATNNSQGFYYEWFKDGTTAPVLSSGTTPNNQTGYPELTGQPAGGYYAVITNVATTCEITSGLMTIDSEPDESLTVNNTVTQPTVCGGTGSLLVENIVGTFDLTLRNTNDNTTVTQPGVTGSTTFSGLVEETAYELTGVQAVSGCTFTPYTITIGKYIETATFTKDVVNSKPDVTCDPATPGTGVLSVTANITGAATLDYQWLDASFTAIAGENGTMANGGTATLSGLKMGDYYLMVANAAKGCADTSQVYSVKNIPTPVNLTVTKKQYEVFCSETTFIKVNGISPATGAYTFELLDDAGAVLQTKSFASVPAGGFDFDQPVAAGTYQIRATNDDLTCSTAINSQIIVNENDKDAVSIGTYNTVDDIVCTDATITPTGEIHIDSLTSVFSAPQGYAYFWTDKDGVTISVVDTVAERESISLVDQSGGDYYLNARNIVTQCTGYDVLKVSIPENIETPLVALNNVVVTECDNLGMLSVNNIQPAGNYNVTLYRITGGTEIALETQVGNAVTFTQAVNADSTYRVRASSVATGCVSMATTPYFDLQQQLPVISIKATNTNLCAPQPTGTIEVMPEDAAATYTYRLYNATTNQWTAFADLFVSGNTVTNLDAGTYYVEASNATNGCTFLSNEVTIGVDESDVQFSVITGNDSRCDIDNGFAQVFTPNITLTWFTNTTLTDTLAHDTDQINGLAEGWYWVRATDDFQEKCPAVDSVYIVGAVPNFEVSIEYVAPVSNCDEDNPNGRMKAVVNKIEGGNLVPANTFNYEFAWFEGEIESGEEPVFNGEEESSFKPITYTLRVTNTRTRCYVDVTSEQVEYVPVSYAAPKIEVISHEQSCISPDGHLRVVDDKNRGNFTYKWFYESSQIAGITNDQLGGRSSGWYTVQGTNRVTGCQTPMSEAVFIKSLLVAPQFEINVQNATCKENDGAASIKLDRRNGAIVSGIEWYNGSIRIESDETSGAPTNINNLEPGTYEVVVTTVYGCSTTKTFRVDSDIVVYNGVSANNDGINDALKITCIEKYPGNSVKLYNRAGTLVFEVNDYNNAENLFLGKGNRGLYINGKRLPTGTYFYVIDLQDGDPARTGFIELSN